MKKQMVADLIIQQLINWGVKRIYAMAGDTLLHFFAQLTKYPEIQLITTRHESNAAFMAAAEAKLTGHLAVCMGHNGPGAANLANGLADAYVDRAPVLALTGQVERWYMGTDYKQYINQLKLLNAVASFSAVINHPNSTIDLLTKAMRTAISLGTVTHLVIPKDIFALTSTQRPRQLEPFLDTTPTSSQATITAAIEIINQVSKPVILVGRGGIMAAVEIQKFADKLGAAIITTLPGRGIIPAAHPHNLGGLGHAGSESSRLILEAADLVIILGATWWPADYVPHQIRIMQIDVNPANLGISTEIAFGLLGKIETILPKLTAGLKTKKNPPWIQRIQKLKNSWEKQMKSEADHLTSPLEPPTIIRALEEVIPEKAVITLDVGDHVVWFNRSFQVRNQQILISGKWRSMGFGLPAAMAAGLVYPEKPICLITGDGGLSMVLGDLITLQRYQIPLKIFLLNNQALAMEMNRMIVSGFSLNGVDLTNPDYGLIAKASGLAGYLVENPKTLVATLKKAINYPGPALVDLKTAATIPPHTKL